MTSATRTSRQALLNRGWYVVTDVETAFLGLSGLAHDLLIVIKHIQGSNQDAFPTQERLASILKKSVRTIQRTLTELASKGALTQRRTGRANRYTVNYCHAGVPEIKILLGGELEIPQELVITDTTPAVISETTDPCVPLPYKESPTKSNYKDPLPTGEGAADASHENVPQEDEMSWNHSAQEPDELDPAITLGLWSSQETTDGGCNDLDGLFPAQEVTPALKGPQKSTRSQRQLDAPYALAGEFAQILRQQPWAGPSPVNKAALARNFSQWKRDGLSADQIRSMMRAYITDQTLHQSGKAPWISFLNARHKLLVIADRRRRADALENTRDNPEEYFHRGLDRPAPEPVDEEQFQRELAAWNKGA
ncbi:helix-turn-helix domain-containing protein [Streptomyces sp. NPDC088252]|uniref:helix-turn-helix domain-containing protein n=1 Tax=Streptomyces sp. NPDC088252 TaxID=3365845 RepID=UPI0038184697